MYNNIMKKKNIFFILGSLALPLFSFAHVKWFAEEVQVVPQYKISDKFVLLSIVFSILIILIGIILEKKLKTPIVFTKYIERFAPNVLSIASIGFGLAFLIFTIQGFIFAPNLKAIGEFSNTMLFIQGLAGVMILFGIQERMGGMLLLFLFVLGIKKFGAIEMLDTLEMVGFAFYAMIIGRPKWKVSDFCLIKNIFHKMRHYALPILRVGTGLNLIILGFTEKILAPSLTQNFLQIYDWNFMQKIGFYAVTDYWFAFFAGVVEVLFGVFFVLGLITRTTTIVLAIFLITTLILLGPVELIGHLPHFSIAIVLLVLGSGTKFKLIKSICKTQEKLE